MARKFTRKIFVNKKTKQMSVTIPKKRLSKETSTLKEGKELFVKLEILIRDKKGVKRK